MSAKGVLIYLPYMQSCASVRCAHARKMGKLDLGVKMWMRK